jgi:hypothetical protein
LDLWEKSAGTKGFWKIINGAIEIVRGVGRKDSIEAFQSRFIFLKRDCQPVRQGLNRALRFRKDFFGYFLSRKESNNNRWFAKYMVSRLHKRDSP